MTGFHQALVDHGDAAVMVIDPDDFSVRWASSAARRLFGNMRGPLPDIVATGDAASVGTFLKAAAAAEPDSRSTCTCAVPVNDSVLRQVDLVARNLSTNPDIAGLVVVASDVTTWAQRSKSLMRRLSTDDKTGPAARITALAGSTLVHPGHEDLADWMLTRKHQVEKLAERIEQLHLENQALAEAANTDQRTGLPNPAAFEAAHAACNRSGEPYSLLLIDIDHFHGYNSIYRYLAGHETLRTIAQTISNIAGGRTFRYGGEEFTVLMPGNRLAEAVELADRIRLEVAGLAIEHKGNPGGIVTISVGAVEVRPHTTVTRAVDEASLAVHQAKTAGRNQVVGRLT